MRISYSYMDVIQKLRDISTPHLTYYLNKIVSCNVQRHSKLHLKYYTGFDLPSGKRILQIS